MRSGTAASRPVSRRTLLRGTAGTAIAATFWLGRRSARPAYAARLEGEPQLPRAVVVPLSTVDQFFPEAIQEASTGPNPSAVGDADATRIVIYASDDGAKKVTLSVDQYPSMDAASSAFQQAVQRSEAVPGFDFLPAPDLGDQAFAGTVTQGGETHVGLGILSGTLIVGATLAGFDATADNIANLIALAGVENDAATTALGGIPSK